MKLGVLLAGSILLGAHSASAKAGGSRGGQTLQYPSSQSMTCAALIAQVDAHGQADFVDGSFLGFPNVRTVYSRRVYPDGNCPFDQLYAPITLKTLDNPHCYAGFQCLPGSSN